MSFTEEKNDGACFVGKEEIELQVKPVNYDDEDFDKFSFFKAIGSWEMADQLFRKTEIVRNKLEEQLLTAISQIEALVQTQNRDSKELIDFRKTIRNQEQQLQAKEEEIKELKDFVGYCFDLQLVGCSNTEKYEGIKNRADEILKGYKNARK